MPGMHSVAGMGEDPTQMKSKVNRLLRPVPILTFVAHAGMLTANLLMTRNAGQLGIIGLLFCIFHLMWLLGGPRTRQELRCGGRLVFAWHDVGGGAAWLLRVLLCLTHFFGVGMIYYGEDVQYKNDEARQPARPACGARRAPPTPPRARSGR